jgi:hypothetical protein
VTSKEPRIKVPAKTIRTMAGSTTRNKSVTNSRPGSLPYLFHFLPAIMGIDIKEDKPLHPGSKMNGHPPLILSHYFTLDIFKKQTTMIADDAYLYGARCPHRNNLINPYKHTADTDIQETSLNAGICIPCLQNNIGEKGGTGTRPSLSLFPHFFSSLIATIQERTSFSGIVRKYCFDYPVTAYTASVILQSILFLPNSSSLDTIFITPLGNIFFC